MEISEWVKNNIVEIKDKSYDSIDFSKLKAIKNPNNYDFNTELSFENCSFDHILFPSQLVGKKISFNNCKIGSLNCYGTYFYGGFEMHNCKVLNTTSFECGVHNINPNKFEITECTFAGYADFFDVYFEGPVKIINNSFEGESNLEVYLKFPFGIVEGMSLELSNNIGNLKHFTVNDPIYGNKG